MLTKEKILWVVNYDNLDDFVARAAETKCTGVAIRTDNNLSKAIDACHARNMAVYGWRWPSAKRDPAMKEAAKVVSLMAEGMDGYFVDPEGAQGKPYDWDQPGLDQLASDFCDMIKSAAPTKPLGTTSHYRAKASLPKLPWAAFFKYTDVFLPQAYWRSTEGVIGHGIPQDNYRASQTFWADCGAAKQKIVPMAGELGVATPAEIDAYAAEARSQGIDRLHFYTFEDSVAPAVWSAVASA